MKFRVYARTNKVGSDVEFDIEVDDEDWEYADELKRDEIMLDMLFDSGLIEWYYEEVVE